MPIKVTHYFLLVITVTPSHRYDGIKAQKIINLPHSTPLNQLVGTLSNYTKCCQKYQHETDGFAVDITTLIYVEQKCAVEL